MIPTARQRGGAAIESLIAMTAISLLVSGGLAVILLTFARVWIGHASYEALICISTSAPIPTCEADIRRKIHSALPFGRLHSLTLSRRPKAAAIEVRFSLGGKLILRHQDSLRLPVRTHRFGRGSGLI